jgi:hypothetical protein
MSNKLMRVAEETRDPDAERNGVWATYLSESGDKFRVLLRRAGASNPEFHALSERLTRAHRKAGRDIDALPVEKGAAITAELYAKTVVVDWNAEDFEAPFSVEGVTETMIADPEFRMFIVREAQAGANYTKAAIAATSGN